MGEGYTWVGLFSGISAYLGDGGLKINLGGAQKPRFKRKGQLCPLHTLHTLFSSLSYVQDLVD